MNRYSKKKGSNPVAGHRVTRSAGILFVASLLALFMVIAGALPALADEKIYPGSMGVRYSGTSTPTHSFGAIWDPSDNQHLYLYLPVIRDLGGGINKSRVRVIDRHYSSDICCTLCSRYRCGCAWCGWTAPRSCSSGSTCNEQVLDTGVVDTNTRSHYYLNCRIPPRYNNNTSSIISYSVREY